MWTPPNSVFWSRIPFRGWFKFTPVGLKIADSASQTPRRGARQRGREGGRAAPRLQRALPCGRPRRVQLRAAPAGSLEVLLLAPVLVAQWVPGRYFCPDKAGT